MVTWYGVSAPICGPDGAVEYWHIGATAMRLRMVVPRMLRGVNSVGTFASDLSGVPGLIRCRGVKNGKSGTPTLCVVGAILVKANAIATRSNCLLSYALGESKLAGGDRNGYAGLDTALVLPTLPWHRSRLTWSSGH